MKKNIAVVEDDKDILEMVEFVLEAADFEVTGYHTAAEFWEGLSTTNPDLILLDIMLPDGNGLAICRALQSAGQTAEIPVVMMSAVYEGVGKECAKADFVKKPFDIDELVSRVQARIAGTK